MSWRCVFGTRQITAGCHPGSFVALLSAERNAVNADKHWKTRVIYNTSIKQVPILHRQQRRLSLLQGPRLNQTAQLYSSLLDSHIHKVIVITVKISQHVFCLLKKKTKKKNSSLVWFYLPIHSSINVLKLKWQWFIPRRLTALAVFPSYIRHWSNQQATRLSLSKRPGKPFRVASHSVFLWRTQERSQTSNPFQSSCSGL